MWHLRLSSHLYIVYCTTHQKLDLSITMRILLLKYCNASPSSSDLKMCQFCINSCVRSEYHNRLAMVVIIVVVIVIVVVVVFVVVIVVKVIVVSVVA